MCAEQLQTPTPSARQAQASAFPPGPDSGRFGLKLIPRYQRDPLDLLMDAAGYGDFVHFKLGGVHTYLIGNPDALHQILVTDAKKFYKTDRTKAVMGEFLGNGLLLSDGDFWKRQRRLAQPAFHHHRINGYLAEMVALTERLIDTWTAGETRDIDAEMMRLALDIAAKTMFDVSDSHLADEIDAALAPVQRIGSDKMRALFSPRWLPTANNRTYSAAVTRLREIVAQIIEQRRASGEDKGDLLSMLLLATDDEGQRMSDLEALDEGMNLLLAGHDTTALSLAWGWYLLAKNPDVEQKVMAEVDEVLGDQPLTLETLPRLRYTEMVTKEILRLYPSAWGFLRQPVEDVQVQGYTIPKGSMILIAPYVMHRNPQYFPEPERFMPERFASEAEAALPRFTYLPFSSGPRVCIGNSFAMMEMRAVIATTLRRYRLELTPHTNPIPFPAFTLRIANTLPLRVVAREGGAR